MDFRTRLTTSGTGIIKEKYELKTFNGSKAITLLVSFARRRQNATTQQQIIEEDNVPIKFWATGAEIINDSAEVGQHIYVESEVRCHGSRLELKAQHFELLGNQKNDAV